MKKAKKLDLIERGKIEAFLAQKVSISQIALSLGRSKSTLSDEIDRGSIWTDWVKSYCAQYAHRLAMDKRKLGRHKGRHPLKSRQTYNFVINHLRDGWSAEQIEGRIGYLLDNSLAGKGIATISYEAIYQFVFSPPGKLLGLPELLPWKRKKRYRKQGRKPQRERIPNRTSIHSRPDKVNNREEFGHWEGDTVIGRQIRGRVIHTEVERQSRFLQAQVIEDKSPSSTLQAQSIIFNRYPAYSTTNDNGLEFIQHEKLEKALGVISYFADPYSSWQRGTNEYHNGLLRRYLPKKTSFENLTQEELDDIVWEINNRPRKCLGFKTPQEVLESQLKVSGVRIDS